MIYIQHKRRSIEKLKEEFPDAQIIDVTSKAEKIFVKLSPFYPHGDIPIPFSNGKTAMSVEGIWQGLKVFENSDIDENMFFNDTMKNLKRTVRKFGKPKGHRKGIDGKELLGYIEARIEIYLPIYLWVLENKAIEIINRLKEINTKQEIVLLDYATNDNVLDYRKPLSHAFLIKAYLEGNYPTKASLSNQKFKVNKKEIDFTKLKDIWSSKSEEELSRLSGIKLFYIKRITTALKNNENISTQGLAKIKGIGKATINKLYILTNTKEKQESQLTLF